MSNNNFVIDYLHEQRLKLVDERQKSFDRFSDEILEIEKSIEILSGNKFIERKSVTHYDDEHPDYIKSSQEEM